MNSFFKFILFSILFFGVEVRLWAVEVRVRILNEQNSITMDAENFRIIASSHRCQNSLVKVKALKSQMIIRYKPSQNSWSLLNLASHQICEINSRNLKFDAQRMFINRKQLPGKILLLSHKLNFDVIAVLDLEKYLVGVLAKEMPAGFPLEAFKAQAIASRSYAMKKIMKSQEREFDLESGVADQMFEYTSGTAKIQTAVEETKSLVLENQKGHLFSVYYHADCGGRTEEPSEVWGSNEKIGSVVDDSCPLESHSSWNFAISKFELSARLRVILQLGDAQILSIEDFENTSSGRKKSLKFVLDDHSTRIISGQQLRNILGFEKLKSTLFAFNQHGADFVFEGKGHGHGVGMCQWGARHLALSGEAYPNILKHYFPRANLARLQQNTKLD